MITNGSKEELSAPASAPIASLRNGRSEEMLSRYNRAVASLGPHYLYVIESPQIGLSKIGIASDINRRLGELQTASAYPLVVRVGLTVPAGTELTFEKCVHRMFSGQRTHGEWFKLSEDDIAFFVVPHPISLEAINGPIPGCECPECLQCKK